MNQARQKIGAALRLVFLMAVCAPLLATVAGARSGAPAANSLPCVVQYLRLTITTGADDLRGGYNNLNVTLRFGKDGFLGAANVNRGAKWDNNTTHTVAIKLKRPVPLNELKSITLDHLANGGLTISPETVLSPIGVIAGLQTADEWKMQSLEVVAVGNGTGVEIARHEYHDFTGSDSILNLRLNIPANSCEVGERYGRLNHGAIANPALRPRGGNSGAASKYGAERLAPSTIQPPASSGPTHPPIGGTAQVPKGSANQRPAKDSAALRSNKTIQAALARKVQVEATGMPTGLENGSTRSIEWVYRTGLSILRRQSATAHSLLLPPVRVNQPQAGATGNSGGTLLNGGARVALNPQPLAPKSSGTLLGPSQTMSSGTPSGSLSGSPAATMANAPSGPTRQQPGGGNRPEPTPRPGRRAPMPTQMCRTGIATIDGGTSGVWFSPVAGQDGQFVIQGCGFGSMPGQVYLTGVQYAKTNLVANVGITRPDASIHPDRVNFTIPPNQWKNEGQFTTSWSDRLIVAQIDPNASGLYDTNNVTLVVQTASGATYQAPGMNFLAARADQPVQTLIHTPYPAGNNSCYGLALSECLFPGINIAIVNSSVGPLTPQIESPTSGGWLNPGQTIAVIRGVIYLEPTDSYSVSFPSGTDTYQLQLAPGFELDTNKGVQLTHASMDAGHCQSLGGVYASSGNWSLSYMSGSSFQVHWEEESCSPGSAAAKNNPGAIGNVSGFAGFSAYELQITVLGPRGVSPWSSGSVNPIVIKQMQNGMLLKNP